jgi:hypothetical protein
MVTEMPKYADITPFYEWLDWLEKESNSRCPDYNTMMFYEIRDKLDGLPEVVRCKDCKWYRPPFCLLNDNKHGYLNHVLPEHFCAYGERDR